jgi:hypothetical protein
MTTTYNIKVVSQKNAIIIIFLSLAIFMGGILIFFPHGIHNEGLSILLVAISFTIIYFIWQAFVTARTRWTINDDGISMTWIEQFAFTNNEDIDIKWNEIESISRGLDHNYYNLKIKLVSGQTIRFYHDTLTTRDDFKQFLKALNDKHK